MRSMILIGIALGCGLIAAIGTLHYLGGKDRSGQLATVRIAVAKTEININEPLVAENVELAEWPRERVPQSAIRDLQQVQNMYARTRLYPGEPILRDKVMAAGDSIRSLKVPIGFRVVSAKVTQDSSVSNLVEPGDRVDIVLLTKQGKDTPVSMAKTILKAVRVFAVNSETTRSTDPAKSVQEVRTVSFLVTPDQAERLLMAADFGQIKLSLRNVDDQESDETLGCTFERLLGVSDTADGDAWLSTMLRRDSSRSSPAANQTPTAPHWTMLVTSPKATYEMRWSTPDATPVRADLKDSAGSAERSEDAAPSESTDDSGRTAPKEVTDSGQLREPPAPGAAVSQRTGGPAPRS